MSNLMNNTAALQDILATIDNLPEASSAPTEDVTDEVDAYTTKLVELSESVTNLEEFIANSSGGSIGGIEFPETISAGDTPVMMASTLSVMCTSSSLSKTGMTITVPYAGTYRFKWYMAKLTDSGLSGTYASRLYKNGTAQGSSQSVTGDWGYKSCSVDVTCAAGDTVEVYGQCRNSSYPLAVGNLTACIDWDNGF